MSRVKNATVNSVVLWLLEGQSRYIFPRNRAQLSRSRLTHSGCVGMEGRLWIGVELGQENDAR